jgi:hypothetical protein
MSGTEANTNRISPQPVSLAEDLLCLCCQRNDAAGVVLGHIFSGTFEMFAGKFEGARWT